MTLAPGERTERRLGVWGSPEVDGCLPTGAYRIGTRYVGAHDRTDGID